MERKFLRTSIVCISVPSVKSNLSSQNGQGTVYRLNTKVQHRLKWCLYVLSKKNPKQKKKMAVLGIEPRLARIQS